MRYYNAIQAARYIGCDPKTVRRMLKRGELTGERTERGWLAIPGGQVEYAKIRWEGEQAKFARPWLSKEASGGLYNASLDMVGTDAMDSIGRLEDRIGQLEEMVSAQNERIASLEQALSNASLHVPIQSVPVPPRTKPQKQPSDASIPTPSDLPPGTLTATELRNQLGIEKTAMDTYIQRGIYGEQLPMTRIPHPTRAGYTLTYFTPEQQERAIELLRKHGKLQ